MSHAEGGGITTQEQNKRIPGHSGFLAAAFHQDLGTNPASEFRTDLPVSAESLSKGEMAAARLACGYCAIPGGISSQGDNVL